MLTLDQVMSTDMYTLKKSDTLQTARMLMLARHIHHVPIVDRNMKILGLVSQRDILSASNSELSQPSEAERFAQNNIKISQIMTTDVFVMDHKDSLLEATKHLLENRSGCIPVVKDDVLAGIVTSFDFIKIMAEKLEAE